MNKLVKNAGITLHLIEPIPELKSSGGPAGTVVGKFDLENLSFVFSCEFD